MNLASKISILKKSELPVYLQISNVVSSLIKRGEIPPGYKMPGTRTLANELNVHRKTVIRAFDELIAQGFIETLPAKGTFVTKKLPTIEPKRISTSTLTLREKSHFSFHSLEHLKRPFLDSQSQLNIDEGLPDLRLSPIEDIRRSHNNFLARGYNLKHLSYDSPAGAIQLRKSIANYLSNTRGLNVTYEHVLITRGSQMGLYLTSQMILSFGDKVIVGTLNYQTSNLTLHHTGADLIKCPIDREGMDTMFIEEVCERQKIKAVYVTSHHHHPTTATLSVERRMHLLSLSSHYGFAILEDDYDYDFHYERSPLMPLASADDSGSVIYMGGISKIIAPGLRIGFLVGPKDFIDETIYLRRIIDRQGDSVMESVMAQFISSGDYQRHSKKVLKVYLERRNLFVHYLNQFQEYFHFDLPSGGLAIWTGLDKRISWEVFSEKLNKNGLTVPNWSNYDLDHTGHNFNRLGFASLNEKEMEKAFDIISKTLNQIDFN